VKKVLFYTTGFFIIFIIVIISILAYLLSSAIGSTTRESDIIKNASEGYGFSIFKWERENFFDKWVSYINPFDNHKKIKSKDQIIEYFSLLERIAVNENLYSELFMENLDLKSKAQEQEIYIDRINNKISKNSENIKLLSEKIDKDKNLINQQKLYIEQYLEESISSILQSDKVNLFGRFFYVPVDFTIGETPKLLVISPRDRIFRKEDKLLNNDILLEDIFRIENQLFSNNNLSAIVVPTGGVSTYPSMVSEGDLLYVLQTSAHEWLHNYLALFPLGRSYFNSIEMQSINETICDIFGNEVGLLAYEKIIGTEEKKEINYKSNLDINFDFSSFMKDTRFEAEKLLSEGKIVESESFMNSQAEVLSNYGYNIRKINQAYFAFYGTYGGNPESINEYHDNLVQIRAKYENLGEMIHDIKYADNIEKINKLLE
tara:strand:- start:476 stop:1768 length:1293 start_codon:yes stop_codon:yes gene_type:complete